MKNKLKVLGICAGQGALLFPFKEYVIANIEPRQVFHTKCESQWKLNFGNIPFIKNPEELITQSIQWDNTDIIVGSPNCGSSSRLRFSRSKVLGKPREDDTINLFIEACLLIQPKVFLMENLPQLLTFIPLESWEEKFSDYDFIVHCHSVSEFGNSQISRKRLILIGIKKTLSRNLKNQLERVKQVNNIKTTRQLLELARSYTENNYYESLNKKLAMYDYRDESHKTLTVKQIRDLWVGDFKNEYKWPINSKTMKTLPGVYRNKKYGHPMTVRPSNRQFRYDGYPLGLNDIHAIMGFPMKFKVYMDVSNKDYWLNKGRIALTKGSVYEVGKWFYNQTKPYFINNQEPESNVS